MKQAIVIFVKNQEISKILKRYHPDSKKIKPHISLVYPFSIKDKKELEKHIKDCLKDESKFEILLKGLKKSAKEYYLYLLINKNKKKILRLYKKLNSEVLSGFENPKIPVYIPHISLGVFKTEKEINNVIKDLKKHKFQVKYMIKTISLLTLNKDYSFKSIKNYKLR